MVDKVVSGDMRKELEQMPLFGGIGLNDEEISVEKMEMLLDQMLDVIDRYKRASGVFKKVCLIELFIRTESLVQFLALKTEEVWGDRQDIY